MRWGFGWELGPFEVWDAIGVEKSIARLKEEGAEVPANVEQMLASGATSFYKKEDGQKFYFDFASGKYVPLVDQPGVGRAFDNRFGAEQPVARFARPAGERGAQRSAPGELSEL